MVLLYGGPLKQQTENSTGSKLPDRRPALPPGMRQANREKKVNEQLNGYEINVWHNNVQL
jgi:hypothetical protein